MDKDDLKRLNAGTRMIKAANAADFRHVNSHIPPIFQTVNFDYDDVDEGMSIFTGDRAGYFYTREANPTADLFAQMVALLEDGEAGIASASGMSAISAALLTCLSPGDEIVSAAAIYGGTKGLLDDELEQMGIQTRFVDITDLEAVEAAITNKTKVLFTEVVANPNQVVADIVGLAELSKTYNLSFIIDNTFTPPPIIQPLKLGADIVIHSATKYFGGHGDIMAGVAVSSVERITQMQQILKRYGGVISPFNAWLAIRGLKTLGVRLERHCGNAMLLAEFLHEHPKVKDVFYPGLSSHPRHELAKQQLDQYGGMMAFEVKGGLEAGKIIMASVNVFNFTVSLGEIDTLIMHPASTSHAALTPEERAAIGITDGLMRVSVGIENIDDLVQDLTQALDKI